MRIRKTERREPQCDLRAAAVRLGREAVAVPLDPGRAAAEAAVRPVQPRGAAGAVHPGAVPAEARPVEAAGEAAPR